MKGQASSHLTEIQSSGLMLVEKRIVSVFIVDEANYIKTEFLNDLKIIFNFEMDSEDSGPS